MELIILAIFVIESVIIKIIEGAGFTVIFDDLLVIIFIVINSIILVILINIKKVEKHGITHFNAYLTASYFIRISFLIFDRYCRHIFTFPNSGLDTGTFNAWAIDYINQGMTGYNGYGAVLGWIYKLYYPNPLWGQYINVIASVFTIITMYKILCDLNIDRKYKQIGVLVLCFIPNYLIMSAILLRESIVTLFLTKAIYHLMEWWNSNKFKDIIISILYVLGATYLHSGTIAYALAIVLIIAFAGNANREFKFRPITVFISLLGVSLFMAIYSNFGDTFFGYMGGLNSVEDVVNKSNVYATGDSAYSVSLIEDSSLLGFIINSPIRVFYFIASPLPWAWRGITDIIAFVGSGFFYTISLYLGFRVITKKDCKNRNLIIAMLMIAVFSALIYSWGVSNAGTALRHRDKFIVNFALILILSLDAKKELKRRGI